MKPHLFSLTVSLMVMRVSARCTEAQTEASTTMFKDCMDEKEAALLERELGPEEDGQQVICDGLASLARVCQPAVDSLARCKGREYADNLVAIHVNSMSGILATFHPDVSLSECPVLATPAPPTIVQTRAETDPASPAYVTAASGPASLASLVMVGAGLWVLRAV